MDLDATAGVLNALLCAVGDAQLLPYLNNYFQVTDQAVTPAQAQQALIEMVVCGIGKEGGAA